MPHQETILVTGGCGFIGSALVRHLIRKTELQVINVDALTYAGHRESVAPVVNSERYAFEQMDICNREGLRRVFRKYWPDAVMHLAAESHVDRSIEGSDAFLQTNVVGTHRLLETSRSYLQEEYAPERENFRFLHVSTDEVYGELGEEGYFTEDTAYDPQSPYSATKAGADHLVRAWHYTYDLPVLITNCSNNYGPYQYPEKLIPVVILKALAGEPIPVYGDGTNVRDWLYVYDHVRALLTVLEKGTLGETYNVGGQDEKKNIEVVYAICDMLDEMTPPENRETYRSQISFVEDRPGHDFRYAIDASKMELQLGWTPEEDFTSGLTKTVRWYLSHLEWCQAVTDDNPTLDRIGALS
ncbi:dTDP-glucose 4,6-dehydratase [Salinibacter ruber]|uniref:dTDP-glucose 4,6-dehydratase n=1 Tax=Salinibacter ruber TaxID=146919 RepID=UPI002168C223|nr:dTDP-glucose 4,6-dehydratase [Salinibacter ruber]MCS4100848.1 dTDP-glucose 4,6-dehydratase [Salinibacter ruber]